MEYFEYRPENQLDFTHPYMTINQMKKMIIRNYREPRDYYYYGESAEDLIADFEEQIRNVFPYGTDLHGLRMPILVFPIPTGEMWEPVKYGFIVKYEANGETVVYSPIKIASLEKDTTPLTEEQLKKIEDLLGITENPVDKLKAELIEIFEEHNFFELAKNYFSEENICTQDYIKAIKTEPDLLKFSSDMKQSLYPIFRKKYGRDRKNGGKALLEKAKPCEWDLGTFVAKLRERRP